MREDATARFISEFETELAEDALWVLIANMDQGGKNYLTTLGLEFQVALNERYNISTPQAHTMLKAAVIVAMIDAGIHTTTNNRGRYILYMRIPFAAFDKIASSFASRYAKVLGEILDENYQPV